LPRPPLASTPPRGDRRSCPLRNPGPDGARRAVGAGLAPPASGEYATSWRPNKLSSTQPWTRWRPTRRRGGACPARLWRTRHFVGNDNPFLVVIHGGGTERGGGLGPRGTSIRGGRAQGPPLRCRGTVVNCRGGTERGGGLARLGTSIRGGRAQGPPLRCRGTVVNHRGGTERGGGLARRGVSMRGGRAKARPYGAGARS
jgi:hypothetical protein